MTFADRRQYERIEYASGARPLCHAVGLEAPVLDCSERGVRVATDGSGWPAVAEEVRGEIAFPGGIIAEFEGVVVRRVPGELAVQFTSRWISRDVIQAEQRRVRRESVAAGREEGTEGPNA